MAGGFFLWAAPHSIHLRMAFCAAPPRPPSLR